MTLQFQMPGKWILMGEHSVIHGFPAIVFPLPQCQLQLSFQEQAQGKQSDPILQAAMKKLLAKAKKIDAKIDFQIEQFQVQSEIPISAGLGSSAALCAAFAKFLVSQNRIQEKDLLSFSQAMEDEFHGKSSGMDLAVVLAGHALLFQKNKATQKIELSWQPHLYLCDSETRSETKACVQKVESQRQDDPKHFEKIDRQMEEAVLNTVDALKEKRQDRLQEAMQLAYGCFADWKLINPEMEAKANWLFDQGAIAVKPTGSGDGGFLLSLWREKPPENLNLISCF